MPTTKESRSVVRARTEEVVFVTIGEGPVQGRVGTPEGRVREVPDSALERRAPAEEARATIVPVDRALAATEALAREAIAVRVLRVPEDLAAFDGPMTVVPGVMIADFAGMIGVKTSLRSSPRPSGSIFFRNQLQS